MESASPYRRALAAVPQPPDPQKRQGSLAVPKVGMMGWLLGVRWGCTLNFSYSLPMCLLGAIGVTKMQRTLIPSWHRGNLMFAKALLPRNPAL